LGDFPADQELAGSVPRDTLCVMSSPLTYPDHPRDDNLAEFFLKMTGSVLKKALLASLVWLFDILP
jgi:hypothetical protein